MVKIILIAAFSKTKNGKLGIGFEGKLPWHVPEDLKHFKKLTTGKTVVMGRKTYESIGKSLPNRTNIVLTRDKTFKTSGIITCNDTSELLDNIGKQGINDEVYIIGGQEIYETFLSYGHIVDSIVLTEIKRNGNMYNNTYIECDRFFPLLDKKFVLNDEYTDYTQSENELYSYRFLTYVSSVKSNKRINCNESVYIDLIKNVIENGNTREDRSGVGTISNFGNLLKFDISNSVPLLTTKRVAWKTAIEEMLWMLSGSTDSKVLEEKGINIWKGHTSREFLDKQGFTCYKEGDLPYGYGHQIRNAGGDTDTCPNCNEVINIDGVDQLLYIENKLKTNPFSRRILWNLWTANQMNKVPLQPCFPAGTLVLTKNGYKNIEDVLITDKLYTHKGNWKNIVNLQKKEYSDTMYEFKLMFNSKKFECTEEHPFFVRNVKRDNTGTIIEYSKEPYWCKAKNITTRQIMCLPINKTNEIPKFNIIKWEGATNQINIEKTITDKNEWFMLGYFIGDGWIFLKEGRNTFNFVINKKQHYVYERISKVLHLTKRDETDKITRYACSNRVWWEIIKDFGHLAHNKKIPEWVQDAPKEMIQHFIDGYASADGCKLTTQLGKEYIQYTTVSENLAYGLQRLYAKLGIMTAVTYQFRPKTTIIEGRTVNQRNTYSVRTINKGAFRKYIENVDENYINFPIIKINKKNNTNPITVYNFEVEDDNSYTVQNVSVHNCHLMIQFYVTESDGIKHLSAMVTMRSNDLGCGNPFNIFNYTALVYMMAMKCDMKPKELVFSIGDAHIYNNHITQLKEQISRQILAAPKLHLEPSIKFTGWNKITIDQFDIIGYMHHPSVKLTMNI